VECGVCAGVGRGGAHTTDAPSAPSAGAAAGRKISLGELLRARYLKFLTVRPAPLGTTSPRPPLPALHSTAEGICPALRDWEVPQWEGLS